MHFMHPPICSNPPNPHARSALCTVKTTYILSRTAFHVPFLFAEQFIYLRKIIRYCMLP